MMYRMWLHTYTHAHNGVCIFHVLYLILIYGSKLQRSWSFFSSDFACIWILRILNILLPWHNVLIKVIHVVTWVEFHSLLWLDYIQLCGLSHYDKSSIYWWEIELSPHFGYCKYSCHDHWCLMSVQVLVCNFSCTVYKQKWNWIPYYYG